MTIIETRPVEITETRPSPPPMEHRLCCNDHGRTVCGIVRTTTDATMMDALEDSDCIVCDDIWDNSRFCPLGGTCHNWSREGGKYLF